MDPKDDIVAYYRDHGRRWDDGYAQAGAVRDRIAYAVAEVRRRNAARVLDAGCGAGHLVHALDDTGFLCDGIDLSPDMLEHARKNQSPSYRGELALGDLTKAEQYPDHRYDVITSFGVFVHEIDEASVLQQFKKKLNPGGCVIISFRNVLFSLLTLNEYTLDFFQELFAAAGHDENEKRMLSDYYEKACVHHFVEARPKNWSSSGSSRNFTTRSPSALTSKQQASARSTPTTCISMLHRLHSCLSSIRSNSRLRSSPIQ